MLVNGVDHLVEWCIPCRSYPDVNIVQQWLIYELDKGIHKVLLADEGYNEWRKCFTMPSG